MEIRMADSAPENTYSSLIRLKIPQIVSSLPETFLERLVTELDDDDVVAIILHGSYARGDATSPYSDVDLVRFVQETSHRKQQRQHTYRDGYLVSISTRTISTYRKRLDYYSMRFTLNIEK
jgi:predicted nucleotidyltransferase